MKKAYARQLVLDLVTSALGLEFSYRPPDDLSYYIQNLMDNQAAWTDLDAEQLKGELEFVLDDIASDLWSGMGLENDGWKQPCEHEDCIAHREMIDAQEKAGIAELAIFLNEMGLDEDA